MAVSINSWGDFVRRAGGGDTRTKIGAYKIGEAICAYRTKRKTARHMANNCIHASKGKVICVYLFCRADR